MIGVGACQWTKSPLGLLYMRLISLNTWTGKIFTPLIAWIKEQAPTTDIFCFQEITDNTSAYTSLEGFQMHLLQELTDALPDFTPHFAPFLEGFNIIGAVDPSTKLGNLTFLRKTLSVSAEEVRYVYREPANMVAGDIETIPRNILSIDVGWNDSTLSIVNFHGAWQENTKKQDTPERILQSQKILDFLKTKNNPKILCGDFNLMPDTESLLMLEHSGLRNLVKEFHITDTRGALYEKPQRFADYVLTSPEITARLLTVPRVQISDHLPMILDIE